MRSGSKAITRVSAIIIMALALFAAVAGAFVWQGLYSSQTSREILIGATNPLTGAAASLGSIDDWAYTRAVNLVNKNGGIFIDGMGNLNVKYISYDDQSNANAVISDIDKLVTVDKVNFLLGPTTTPLVAAAAGEAEKLHIVMVTAGTSSIALRQRGFRYIFFEYLTVDQNAETLFSALSKLPKGVRPKTVAIWAESSDLGKEFREQIESLAPQFSMTIVLDEIYAPGAIDYSDLIVKTKSVNPDIVMALPTVPDGITFMRQSKQLDLNPRLFFMGRASSSSAFHESLGKDAEYVTNVDVWTPGMNFTGNKELVEDYKTAGRDIGNAANLGSDYSAATTLLDAIKTARSLDTDKVRQVLLTHTFRTVEGSVTFNENGNAALTGILLQFQQGVLVAVYPENLATARFIYPAAPWSQR
jgi:branched-chain amino acid transport system substrate-binding protein